MGKEAVLAMTIYALINTLSLCQSEKKKRKTITRSSQLDDRRVTNHQYHTYQPYCALLYICFPKAGFPYCTLKTCTLNRSSAS